MKTQYNDSKDASIAWESHHITYKLMHRLASENPRIIEYCFSDRPDEIFTDRDLLMKHRGLTLPTDSL